MRREQFVDFVLETAHVTGRATQIGGGFSIFLRFSGGKNEQSQRYNRFEQTFLYRWLGACAWE